MEVYVIIYSSLCLYLKRVAQYLFTLWTMYELHTDLLTAHINLVAWFCLPCTKLRKLVPKSLGYP